VVMMIIMTLIIRPANLKFVKSIVVTAITATAFRRMSIHPALSSVILMNVPLVAAKTWKSVVCPKASG
jgi:hypothetical protein